MELWWESQSRAAMVLGGRAGGFLRLSVVVFHVSKWHHGLRNLDLFFLSEQGTPRCPPLLQSVYESLFRDCQSGAVVWRPDHPVAMPFFPLPALLDQDYRLHRKQVDPPERVFGVDVAPTLLSAGWSPLFTWCSSTSWFNLTWINSSLRRLRCNCRERFQGLLELKERFIIE